MMMFLNFLMSLLMHLKNIQIFVCHLKNLLLLQV